MAEKTLLGAIRSDNPDSQRLGGAVAPVGRLCGTANNGYPNGMDETVPKAYDPRFCTAVIEVMGEGHSLTAFAGAIGVSRETVLDWVRAHRDFAEAVQVARAARAYRLEQTLLSGANNTGAVFALKNACPEEWRDRREIDHNPDERPATSHEGAIALARAVALILARAQTGREGET